MPKNPTTSVRVWAIFRLLLGFAQTSGAAIGLGFLVSTGVSTLTITTVCITLSLSLLSLCLFQERDQ